jgi:hypothetical protein
MRFFSNDKDSGDDQQGLDVRERAEQVPQQAHDEHPERVTSEPVSVPQQRAGSPWSSAPDADDTPDAELAARERADPVDVALDDQGGFDDPHVRDASTTTREDTTPPDTRGTETAAGGTGPGGTAAAGTLAGATSAAAMTERRDRDGGGEGDRDPALRDDGTFDGPRAVDPGTDRPLDAPAQSAPVVAPAAATGTAVAQSGTVESLFDAGDARMFRERWRDVQLRFVDSPKEATAEAAGLLDEAIDRLAAGLREQKARLAGDGAEDTERLRVELRAYRDMLNRILDL